MPKPAKNQILPDSASDSDDSSAPNLECETCGIDFPTLKALQDHMSGKRHAKKVAQEKQLAKLIKDEEAAANKSAEEDDDHGDDGPHCDVCDKSFTGHMPYLTHLKGAGHKKALRKAQMKQTMAHEPGVIAEGDESDDDEDGVVPRKFASCPACKKEFYGPEAFADHLKSAAHKRKVGAAKIQVDPDDHEGEADSAFAKCKACSKSFSGPIPYRTHMLSGVHRKNLERAKVAEEMRKVCKRFDPEEGFVCADCDKAFADPLAFKAHLANNSHERARTKKEMKDFLERHPEIVFVAPFGEFDGSSGSEGEGEEGGSAPGSRSDFFLICKVCELSFAGVESARAHVKSQRHQKQREKRLVMKVMRAAKKGEKAENGRPAVAKKGEKAENGRPVANGAPARKGESAENGRPANGAAGSPDDAEGFELV